MTTFYTQEDVLILDHVHYTINYGGKSVVDTLLCPKCTRWSWIVLYLEVSLVILEVKILGGLFPPI